MRERTGAGVESPPRPERPLENREGTMPLLEHLDELRSRIFKAALGLLIAFVICAGFSKPILDVLLAPVQKVLPEGQTLAFIRLPEPFFVRLKAAALVALFLATPVLLYQLWRFVAPGLYRHERRWFVPFLVFGTLFAVAGGAFGYLMIAPVAAMWLVGIGRDFSPMVTLQEAFAFVSRIMIGLGIVFELPVVIFILARVGVVTPAFLWRHFRIVILLIAIMAAVVTPPDPVTMLLVAGPMILLYLLGIGVAWVSARRSAS